MEDGANGIRGVLHQLINALIGFGGNMKASERVEQFWDVNGGANGSATHGTELAIEGLNTINLYVLRAPSRG